MSALSLSLLPLLPLSLWLFLIPIALVLAFRVFQNKKIITNLSFDRKRLKAILDLSPDGFFYWSYSQEGLAFESYCSPRLAILLTLSKGLKATIEDILSCFDRESSNQLQEKIGILQETGQGFLLELTLSSFPRRIIVKGLRAINPESSQKFADILWMKDVTEEINYRKKLESDVFYLGSKKNTLAAMLDQIGIPVWLRDSDLSLQFYNRSFAEAINRSYDGQTFDSTVELVETSSIRAARTLASRARAAGEPRSEIFHLVMGGKRRLAEITERPFFSAEGGLLTLGYAFDQTKREELQTLLDQQTAIYADLLENLGTAIAIFSADTRLNFFNAAFRLLWQLEPSWLESKPGYGHFLDRLREQRLLPEVADYKAFRAEEIKKFTSLLESKEELLYRPDGRTLRQMIAVHPFGGLIFAYEDVSDLLAQERLHKTSLAVHNEIFIHLQEAIAIFSPDGRLRFANPAFISMWKLLDIDLTQMPHFCDILDHQEITLTASADWSQIKEKIAQIFSDRIPQQGHFQRSTTEKLSYNLVPLPDGSVLISWNEQ
jgi:PAS domain-containing protein